MSPRLLSPRSGFTFSNSSDKIELKSRAVMLIDRSEKVNKLEMNSSDYK